MAPRRTQDRVSGFVVVMACIVGGCGNPLDADPPGTGRVEVRTQRFEPIPGWCTLQGGATRDVTVVAGEQRVIQYRVACG